MQYLSKSHIELCSFAIFGNYEVNKNCHFWQFLDSIITDENENIARNGSLRKDKKVMVNIQSPVPTVLQSKRANFVVFKIFCYFQASVQEGSTLSLWEDTTSTCTALWEVTCCHMT